MSSSLGRLAWSGAALVVAFAWSASAAAYCRTTTQPLPADYSPTRGCFTQGKLLFWRNACVGYSINQAASRNIPLEAAKAVIDASFGAWMATTCSASGAPPGILVTDMGAAECSEVRFNPIGKNQNVIVFRDDVWPYSDPNSTLGLTTVTFNADTGEMYDADMEINSSGHNLSTTDNVPANGFDLQSVITHEAGHFFGLAHATSPSSTMFASYKPGRKDLRSLESDDVDGLCAIYPDSATRIVTATTAQGVSIVADKCDSNPKGGLTVKCAEAVPAKSNCEVAPSSSSSPSLTPMFGLALVGLVVSRRRLSTRRLAVDARDGSARPR